MGGRVRYEVLFLEVYLRSNYQETVWESKTFVRGGGRKEKPKQTKKTLNPKKSGVSFRITYLGKSNFKWAVMRKCIWQSYVLP